MDESTCAADGCPREPKQAGMCGMHYQRVWKYGTTELPPKGPRLCVTEGCGRDLALDKATGRGMCSKHYQRWRKHGDPLYERPIVYKTAPCSIDGCAELVIARGWCTAHWTRWKRHGSPTARMRGEVVDGKRICPQCSEDRPLSEWTKGACKTCVARRAAARREVFPDPRAPRQTYTCRKCAAVFEGEGRIRIYCSRECLRTDKSNVDWKFQARRRAVVRAAAERFDRLEVFERDRWECGICGREIDPSVRHPDPLSPSVDHIVPLSRGGAHVLTNVQAAHLTCNVRKGAALG